MFWIGAAIPFAFSCMYTFALNDPRMPLVSLRADTDIVSFIQQSPWNHMGRTSISFYPFVLGIAYLIPVDVTFSSWFFFFVTRSETSSGRQ